MHDGAGRGGTQAAKGAWAADLDSEQARLCALRAPLIVVEAAPGTGKTRTLIARFLQLVASGADPARIAVCTFTRRAAHSFRARLAEACRDGGTDGQERLAAMLAADEPGVQRAVDAPDRPWVGTFHEMCGRIVRCTPQALGWAPRVRTLNEPQSLARLGQAMAEARCPGGPEGLKRLLSAVKRHGRTCRIEGARSTPPGVGTPPPHLGEGQEAAVALYDERNRREGVADYDDLIAGAWALLNGPKAIREAWAKRFDHLMVDESQDADPIQLEIVARLAPGAEVVLCGDPDQGIYGFRGAIGRYHRIESLERTAGVEPIRVALGTDYRLPKPIHRAVERLRRKLQEGGQGPEAGPEEGWGPPRATVWRTREAMLAGIAGVVRERVEGAAGRARGDVRGSEPHDVMVLSRTRGQTQDAAHALAQAGVPVWMDSGDVLMGPAGGLRAWVEAAVWPDDAALEVAMGATRTRIRMEAFRRLEEWARPMHEVLMDPVPEGALGRRAGNAAAAWRRVRRAAIDDGEGAGLRLVSTVREVLALDRWGEAVDAGQSAAWRRTWSLAEAIGRRGGSPEEIADAIGSGSGGEDEAEGPKGCVAVRTMHRAKGLEARHVVCTDWTQGRFPGPYAEDVDEERRVALVAVSRAVRTFDALSCRNDGDQGGAVHRSQFIYEAGMEETEGREETS